MEFRNLKVQYQNIKQEMDQAISEVINNANFISGHQVKELEEELAQYVGMKHCISCANGTDALTIALMTWGIGVGDAVFVPDFTFFSSGEVVSYAGAKPVFVDVCKDTYNMDPDRLEIAIKAVIAKGEYKPRVIIAVDLFGQPADYTRIKSIADKYNLLVLEDSAQGFGGMIGMKKACSFGNIATTSFFPAKPLGCYGDGGAIFVNDDEQAKLIRSLCVHGKGSFKYDNVRIGMNSRLDTLQAAILKVKFQKFQEYELEAVNHVADAYTKELSDYVIVPMVKDGYYSSWAQYTIQLRNEEQRNALQSHLKNFDIPSMIYYPKPMHKQGAFGEYDGADDLSVTTKLCETVLSLPIHPYMTEEEIKQVTRHVSEFVERTN